MASFIPNLPDSTSSGRNHKRDSSSLGKFDDQCNQTITLSQPNSYYPTLPGAIWVNCCGEGTDPSHCQPVQTYAHSCPIGYSSCADFYHHGEMCTVEYFNSQDGSGVFGYGNRLSRTLQQKCCPDKYSCGGSFDAPCIYIQQSAQPAILTNPMYVKTIGVYPGCDENGITPAAVGAIVALAIIAMCAIGGLLLWVVKNYLHRDPNRQYNRQMKAIAAATAAARAKTIDLEYGESDIGVPSTGRESSGSVGFPAEAAKQEKGRRGLMLAHSRPKSVVPSENYEMMSNKHRGDGGEFSAVQLEDQTQVLDFAGITVTREVQIVREDGGGSGRGGGSRDGSENGSGSGSGGKVPGTGIGNLEGPVQILGSRGDSDSISERRQGHNHGVHPYPYGLVWSAHGHAQSDTSNSYSTGPSTSTMASYPILSASGDSLMARTDDTSL